MTIDSNDDWLEDDHHDETAEDDISIDEYDLTSTPNDFNVKTIVDFIQRGVFVVPAFQRNYVWDIRRASKLIESVIMGLPVPQIFLYEKGRNQFLVIDGQQRLLSLFYFVSKRFPRMEKRGVIRRQVEADARIEPRVLADDTLFSNFNLDLPAKLLSQANRLQGLNYDTLAEDRTTLDMRTIRCVVVKQNAPREDDSSVYEIFHRLNTGGVNLTPQEIRTSLYHSDFYTLLYKLNVEPGWRRITGVDEPDLRMRDVEVLLRGFAMLLEGKDYKPSMTHFLNQFSKRMQRASPELLKRLDAIFAEFLAASASLPPGAFGTHAKKLNVTVFEAVFAAACSGAYNDKSAVAPIEASKIQELKSSADFMSAASAKSTDKSRVETRLNRARTILAGS